MRLLKTSVVDQVPEFEEFFGNNIPPYAILSHTWNNEEVLCSDVKGGTCRGKEGYYKFEHCIEQAKHDGLHYVWIDSACIDKSSSSELSEAINSMFSWYGNAVRCYAYLADVDEPKRCVNFGNHFKKSRWFRRGWTLQELLAPTRVDFFSRNWSPIGTKEELSIIISEITTVDIPYLTGQMPILSASVAKRMSWAASRATTRVEDIAYCLLGIFEINMPLLYGEGKKAFIRLQEEIIKTTDDHTVFAWKSEIQRRDAYSQGLLADSPHVFKDVGHLTPYRDWEHRKPFSMTNLGLCVELFLSKDRSTHDKDGHYHALLQCPGRKLPYTTIRLQRVLGTASHYMRVGYDFIAETEKVQDSQLTTIYVRQSSTAHSHGSMYANTIFVLQGVKDQAASHRTHRMVTTWPSVQTPAARIYRFEQPKRIRPWMEPDLPWVFDATLPSSAAAILFFRRADSKSNSIADYLAISLGLSQSREIGFDVCDVHGSITEETIQHVRSVFQPQRMGSDLGVGGLVVTVSGREQVTSGTKICLIDIFFFYGSREASGRCSGNVEGGSRRCSRFRPRPAPQKTGRRHLPGDRFQRSLGQPERFAQESVELHEIELAVDTGFLDLDYYVKGASDWSDGSG